MSNPERTYTIDIEPKWIDILKIIPKTKETRGIIEELEKPCKIADIVRQAQKRGESVTFHKDGGYETTKEA